MAARSFSQGVRRALAKRDGHVCRACGIQGKQEADHCRPHCAGGDSSLSNAQLLCAPCNAAKSNRALTLLPWPATRASQDAKRINRNRHAFVLLVRDAWQWEG